MSLTRKFTFSVLILVNLVYLPETKAAPLLANVYKLKNYDQVESNRDASNQLDSKEVHSGVQLKEIEILRDELFDAEKIMNAMKKKLRRMIRKISKGADVGPKIHNNSIRERIY